MSASPSTAGRNKAPKAAPAAKSFTITELAAEFDVTPRAIRFYEDCGLLAPQRVGRNRVYTARDRTRLKLTLRGKRLGLTLAEVRTHEKEANRLLAATAPKPPVVIKPKAKRE